MQRVDSLEKPLILGGIGDRRRRGQQRMRWLDGITLSWWWTGLACCGSQGHKESDTTERLNWTADTYEGQPTFRMFLLHCFSSLTSPSAQTCFSPSYRHFHRRALINILKIIFIWVCFQGTKVSRGTGGEKQKTKTCSLPSLNIFPKNDIYILRSKKWIFSTSLICH